MQTDSPSEPDNNYLRCPQCQESLAMSSQVWSCCNRHSFDIARQGYANLLPVQKKKSRFPGDNPTMVDARRRFLNTGYYQTLSDHINQAVLDIVRQRDTHTLSVVDAGCGEGYYTSRLLQSLSDEDVQTTITGFDISKFAIKAAAQRDKTIRWFVANVSDLPIMDHRIDLILCLFSPIETSEFHRCLTTGGSVIVASTGPAHLIELRRLLYDEVKDSIFEPAEKLKTHFNATTKLASWQGSSFRVRFPFTVRQGDHLKDLLAMTPHYWRAKPSKKSQLNAIEQLTVTADIKLSVYSPQPSAGVGEGVQHE